MKRIIIILTIFIFVWPSINAQSSQDVFSLHYSFSGLGSSQWMKQPTIRILGNQLIYTYEQHISWGDKVQRPDTIKIVKIKESSIESILQLTRNLKDSNIFEFNPCIMSGSLYYLAIIDNQDSTTFTLTNTFHRTALKIIEILNPYLPRRERIKVTEQYIIDCEECWAEMKKRRREKEENKE